ncbi:hypothetical protein HDU98_009754 [Podochytrium sp. JEL0797]|nr:hypothetical protein HDU98_009754 [Podochytrium sp. JEL0797]
MSIRDKTREGLTTHILEYNPSSPHLLLGDSHIDRLTWHFPTLAPPHTWLCGVGGDRISQLAWRIANPEDSGYTQHARIMGTFTRIGIMIGSNDILAKRMTDKQITAMVKKVQALYLIVKTRFPEAQVCVFPIPPIPTRGFNERDPQNVEMYNLSLREARLIAEGCVWPEMDLEGDFEDHVHLSMSGYRKWWIMVAQAGWE